MADRLSASAARVQGALEAIGIEAEVRELPESTRTAPDAARALGCRVEQIAKSIVFRATESGAAVMVVAGGANRVDERKVRRLVGEVVERASPDFVRERTGFAIGGVPPLGHATAMRILFDPDLLREPVVWAAAGTPRGVFAMHPRELLRATGGEAVDVKR